ncbi:hypothetical protein WUBG_04860 [Wuchereria bancrofti]|uniref:Uncharacterized protein n=1 Tax=Wuchereria bancrofti TaxID=6293 RepID=J9EPV4_WUCBA|nr:hypothetical protein WUBG_04860 [Wuchereria bancrofti]
MVGEEGEGALWHSPHPCALQSYLNQGQGMAARKGRGGGGGKEESILTKALLNCSLNALLVVRLFKDCSLAKLESIPVYQLSFGDIEVPLSKIVKTFGLVGVD